MTNRTSTYYSDLADAVESRTTGAFDWSTCLYVTDGGTLVIASSLQGNDDNRAHDLAAVLPAGLGALNGRRVIPLRPTVNPDLIDFLEAELVRRAEAVKA